MRSKIENRKSKILIAGGGPAGSSLAIRLARSGFETVLVERERFPRPKLCGEFISPECLDQFEDLQVLERMLDAGGDRILETRFYESGGRSIAVPNDWFAGRGFALSLSRAAMDKQLLDLAAETGVRVMTETAVTGVNLDGDRIASLKTRGVDGRSEEIPADLFIDATGRSRVVAKAFQKDTSSSSTRPRGEIVGFKAHMSGAEVPKGVCEIYSFPGGYAGLSNVENGEANLCFMLRSRIVRDLGKDVKRLIADVVLKNRRAEETLRTATATSDWLAVSIDSFGVRSPSPARNLLSAGDAAAFIDPFTGSGMLMALESAEVLANAIVSKHDSPDELAALYQASYRSRFSRRMRVCSILRRTAFMPTVASAVVAIFGTSRSALRVVARSTRG